MEKKWIFALVIAILGAQPLFAQEKFSWKNILISPAFRETQTDVEKKLKQAVIRKLQAKDTTPHEEDQMRAYQINPQAILHIQFEPQSYKAINYNKEYAENCRAMLLDKKGTVLLNDTCRKALFHTKEKIAFQVDFSSILPGYTLKVSNYPRRSIVFKDNYALANIPLTENLKERLPAIKAPVFVAKRDRWLIKGEKYIVPFSFDKIFDSRQPQDIRRRMSKSLPDYFFAKLEGFH